MTADLTNPVFQDEAKAREWLEASRWPNGAICPHCRATGERVKRLEGKVGRPGLWQCYECDQQFTVTVGTLYERSHIPLHKWLLATHLLTSSKKGISAHQLHRMLGITYKSAWFMAHRIREAMGDSGETPMGSGGGTVEADETYIGRKPARAKRTGHGHKLAVMSLVERGGGVRSFHVDDVSAATLRPILDKNVSRDAHLMSDEAKTYTEIGWNFASHKTVRHGIDEYVRGTAHTNTIEGFFSIFKRGMKGVYQHCGEQHLHRYLKEFDFRYSNRKVTDAERARKALKGIEGKRLTYRRTSQRLARPQAQA
ncbi:MAG: IS1595 family transposase [Alphaproteobacteria bacterium]|nr:IS1595 family transposase [Alphaproteobacteria bacterium]